MGVTVLPPRGTAAAPRAACASRRRLDPTRIGRSSTAAAAAKKPKRPGSCGEDEPAMKRRRAGEKDGAVPAAVEAEMSAAEKDDVNHMLISLLPAGRSPHEVNPLPDSVVRVLQEKRTRCFGGGGADDEMEIEIDVHPLGDDALRAIKKCVGAYLGGSKPLREEEESQNKEGIIGQSERKSIPSRAGSKRIPSKAALRAAVHSIPAPSKPTEIRESVSKPVETAISESLPRSASPTASSSLPAPPKHVESPKSMSEVLAAASKVLKEVVRRREIEKLRAAARLEVEQVVRTVEFNDPYIDYTDVFK